MLAVNNKVKLLENMISFSRNGTNDNQMSPLRWPTFGNVKHCLWRQEGLYIELKVFSVSLYNNEYLMHKKNKFFGCQ